MYTPTKRKPGNVCFWCHKEFDDISLVHKDPKFGHYYSPCLVCRSNMEEPGFVAVQETTDFQGLIDQPPLNGSYPTGRWCLVKKKGLQLILDKLRSGLQVTETTQSVQVSPPLYAILIGMAYQ